MMLKFFPSKESVIAEVGKLLNELCSNDQEARRLTAAVLAEFSEWPGPLRIRETAKAQNGGSLYVRWEPPRAESNSANGGNWFDEIDREFKARRDLEWGRQ